MKILIACEYSGTVRDAFAALNANEKYMKEWIIEKLEKNGIGVALLEKEGFDNFPKWRLTFNGNTKEVSFIHQVQNAYEDWTGKRLL